MKYLDCINLDNITIVIKILKRDIFFFKQMIRYIAFDITILEETIDAYSYCWRWILYLIKYRMFCLQVAREI